MVGRENSRAASSDGILVPVPALAAAPLFAGLEIAELVASRCRCASAPSQPAKRSAGRASRARACS